MRKALKETLKKLSVELVISPRWCNQNQNVYVAKVTKRGDRALRRREFHTYATLDELRTSFTCLISFKLVSNDTKLVLHINNQKEC